MTFRARPLPACLAALSFFLVVPASAQLGYFHVEMRQNVWWLIAPSDRIVFLAAADRLRYAPSPRYPDESAWDFEALARLERWRFNAIGPDSDPALWNYRVPYVMDLHIADHAGAAWSQGHPLDVFDPAFAKTAHEIADEGAIPRSGDHWLVGYLSDDDIPWNGTAAPGATMLAAYLALPSGAPGREAALHFLRMRYRDSIRSLGRAWGIRRPRDFDYLRTGGATAAFRADAAAFLAQVAARYFQTCADAIHRADPNHLYLGALITLPAPDAVLMAARVGDVVSVATTDTDPSAALIHAYRMAGKPVWAASVAVPAANFAAFVRQLASLPFAIGYGWQAWTGAGGFVDAADRPDAALATAATAANRSAAAAHARAQP